MPDAGDRDQFQEKIRISSGHHRRQGRIHRQYKDECLGHRPARHGYECEEDQAGTLVSGGGVMPPEDFNVGGVRGDSGIEIECHQGATSDESGRGIERIGDSCAEGAA